MTNLIRTELTTHLLNALPFCIPVTSHVTTALAGHAMQEAADL